MSASTHLVHALAIQRKHPDPKDWKAALEQVPPEAQEECRRYLRGMYYRAAVVATIQGNKLCPTDPQPFPKVPPGT